MKKFFGLLVVSFVSLLSFFACSIQNEEIDFDQIASSLKDQQAKVIVEIDGKPFYEEDRIFTGSVMVASTSIRANLYDHLRSNVIASVMKNDWYKASVKKFQVKAGENTNVNVLIGKITDSTQNKGIGYLFMNGECQIVKYTKDLLVFKFEGLTSEYMKMSSPEEWQKIKGYIVIRKPNYQFTDIDEKSFF